MRTEGWNSSPEQAEFCGNLKTVSKPLRKKDAEQLLTGQPVYTDDLAPKDCLIVKILHSPHANAIVQEISTEIAKKVPGIEAVFTWEDVPQDGRRFTLAGQTEPEPSPRDRLVIDRHVRFVGDVVAIVAGENEKCVDKALSLIKVKYEVLPAVLDYHKAKDNETLVHPESSWDGSHSAGSDAKRNLCSHDISEAGDVDAVLNSCDVVIDRTYHTKACSQAMMETFRTFCTLDPYGRLNVVSSTQIVFHCRRIIANALGIPRSMVRVSKPRIGGGFGAKQTAISEVFPAFVTWKTGKPSKIVFSREESQTMGSPRHEMEIHVRLGAMKDGTIRGIDLYTISNTGAYGEHGPTTVGLSGHKAIPIYGKQEAYRFVYDVVYTNVQAAGAYRGYGATQGFFAVESAVNELAHVLGRDPFDLRLQNVTREGEVMPAYYGETNTSCALDRCLEKVRRMIRWDEKYPARIMPDGKIRSVGMAVCMQGSSISGVDQASARLKLNDDGFYTLSLGSGDMGTGSDTTMAQIAAEVLQCSLDRVTVTSGDTDTSPYDSGSYASSTAFLTGYATEKAARKLREEICSLGARLLKVPAEKVGFDGEKVFLSAAGIPNAGAGGTDALSAGAACTDTSNAGSSFVTLKEISDAAFLQREFPLEVTETHISPTSPPPFMAGAVELEVDPETGEAKVLEYDACVDCGTPLNLNLVRVQAEGGILQGIGMALMENITYDRRGRILEDSLMNYRIPTRNDLGHINVEFECSYEKSGPFGAKSIGEVVLNTPGPAIADAVYNAVGLRCTELPITPEMIALRKPCLPDARMRE